LFAHSIKADEGSDTPTSVELWDCRASAEQFLRGIPKDFDGVIDLSVCDPFEFAEVIERARPNCSVAIVPYAVHPAVWSEVYLTIFEVLNRFHLPYLDALEKVVCEYRAQGKRRLRMSSNEVMRMYLERLGQLPMSVNSVANAGSTTREPSASDSAFLRELASQQSAVNRRVLTVGLTMVVVVFIVALVGGVKSGGSPPAILASVGIGGGAEAGLLTWVLRLWREYNIFSFLLLLSQGDRLSPTELMKVVGEMSFGSEGRTTKRPRPGTAPSRAAASSRE
jgi:hypothetical protein